MALPIINEENSLDILHAYTHVWNHTFNFIYSMSLKCAVELSIPDIIHRHGKPMKLQELVDALPINATKAHGVRRLMRLLTHSGFFIEENLPDDEENVTYWLTPSSRLLIKDEPLSMVPFLVAMLDPILIDPWHCASEWFKTSDGEYDTSFQVAHHGRTIWELAEQEPRFNKFFHEAMASDSRLISSVLIRDCKHVFEGLNSIVDVAGGTGTLAKNISDAFPNMKCTVLDLPHVVAGLKATNKNLSYVEGDMFEYVPPADAVILKWILHDWKDDDCIKILKKCKEAIPATSTGGKVIIIDMIIANHKKGKGGYANQLFSDVIMLVDIGGKERDEKEWAKLFRDAGFTRYKIAHKLLGLKSLIEVYP